MEAHNGCDWRRNSTCNLQSSTVFLSGCSLPSRFPLCSAASAPPSTSVPGSSLQTRNYNSVRPYTALRPPPLLHERPFLRLERNGPRGAAATCSHGGETDEADSGYCEWASEYHVKQPQICGRSNHSTSRAGNARVLDEGAGIGGETEVPGKALILQQLCHQSGHNSSNKQETVVFRCSTAEVMDSVDDFFRRGSWKRRGVVFDMDDMEGG